MKNTNQNNLPPNNHAPVSDVEIQQALLQLKWIEDTSDAQLLKDEAEFNQSSLVLPERLNSSDELFAKICAAESNDDHELNSSTEVARAARIGGIISPEVEKKMKADRDKAQAIAKAIADTNDQKKSGGGHEDLFE